MRSLLHSLGFHGGNWQVIWYFGNLWTECSVCGRRRMIPFGDYAEMPKGMVIPDRTPPADTQQ
jgi:hypothetical protein